MEQQSQQPPERQTSSSEKTAPVKKNSKLLWILGVFFAACLVIGGAVLFFGYIGLKKTDKEIKKLNNEILLDENNDEKKSGGGALGEGIREWIQKKAGVKCVVNDPESGQMTMIAKGDKIKIDGFNYDDIQNPSKESKGTMLTDGEWSYVWSGKEGVKFNLKDMEKFGENQREKNQNENTFEKWTWENWAEEMELGGASYDCSAAALTDNDFKVPVDVNFIDWGKQMEQFLNIGENIQQNIPDFNL